VDEALCVGWLEGARKSIDEDSLTIPVQTGERLERH
jgi:hypothetical protein